MITARVAAADRRRRLRCVGRRCACERVLRIAATARQAELAASNNQRHPRSGVLAGGIPASCVEPLWPLLNASDAMRRRMSMYLALTLLSDR